MPAIVALQRHAGGKVSVIVGEDAVPGQDDLEDILVVDNIKRLALSSDAYVDWHLEVRDAQEQTPDWPPTWWNPQKRCVQAWGEEFPVWDLIRDILAEAFRRVGITFDEEFEWRAGCPIHANLNYRADLSRVLSGLTGKGNVSWIIEEPILFLILALRLGNLADGSYLVYDIGGGSFDCALVEVRENDMRVYGADGHPLMGGSDIDAGLVKRKNYRGQLDLIRQVKERLTPSNPSETLADGTVITFDDVEATLHESRFGEKSISTMRDAYVSAKVLWKRSEGEDDPPIGEIITRNAETGTVRFVWQLMWDDMAEDIDKIILSGGPTKSPYFRERLSKRFGPDKVITASDLLSTTLTGTPDLELVGISMGACYSYEDSYSPLYLSRLPAHITLQDLQLGEQVEYKPYQHFEYKHIDRESHRRVERASKPFEPYFSKPLTQEKSDPHYYELTVTDPNEVVIERHSIDGYVKPGEEDREKHPDIHPRLPATSLRLVIDRFGRVGVEKHSSGPGLPWTEMFFPVKNPWQLPEQRQALQTLVEQQAKFEEEHQQLGRDNINRFPWNYPTA